MIKIDLQLLGSRGARLSTATASRSRFVNVERREVVEPKKNTAETKYKIEYNKDGRLRNKDSVVNLIEQQLGVKLVNDKTDILNKKRRALYTKIERKDRNNVLGYIKGRYGKNNKLYWEDHVNGYGWLMF